MQANVDALMGELTEWAKSARMRDFTADEIVTALSASSLVALEGAGVTYQAVVDLVHHHFGLDNYMRPSVQA